MSFSAGTVMRRARAMLVAIVGSAALAACASSSTTSADLEKARGDVLAAASDPLVGRYARGELESAQDAFAEAERNWRRRSDADVVSHWSYLAGQRAATARETARLRQSEEQIQAAEAEQQQKQAEQQRIESESLHTAPGAASGEMARASGGDVVVTFADNQFQQNGAELGPGAGAGLDRIAGLLRQDPQLVVRLESHVDDTGSRSRSIEVSGRRAEAVRAALVSRGVEPRRIVVRALGDSYPVASNETELGRERNRRVEAVVAPASRSGGT
jgi:outer membrane protein OmpA-like peptidoglycan-associated protein